MASNLLPPRLQLNRAMLSQAFPNSPQLVLAFEQIFQSLGTPGSGTTNTTGEMVPFGGSLAPSGWLVCDGSAVGRQAYPNLFAVIGTTWGAGDGQTTFNVPDMRGRMPIGAGETYPLGTVGGAASTVLGVTQLPSHNHGVTDPGHTHAVTDPGHTHTVTDPGHAHVVTDPGHNHATTDPGHHHTAEASATAELALDAGSTGAAIAPGNTGTATTGVTINTNTTGVTVNAHTTGVTNQQAQTGVSNQTATTGVTTQNTGQGAAVPTLSPYAAVNWLIKT
jgi:microcystin-dependent protein